VRAVIFGAAGDLSCGSCCPRLNLNVDGVFLPISRVGFGLGRGRPDEWIRARAYDGIGRFSRRKPTESTGTTSPAPCFTSRAAQHLSAYTQLKAKLEALAVQFGIPAVGCSTCDPAVAGPCAVSHLAKPAW